MEYNITEFGAKGNGVADDSFAIQQAIDTCSGQGGGRIVVPSGRTFLSGPFKLKSNIEFHVGIGAKLLANPDESVYTESAFRENRGEGSIWIGGENIENVIITGGGTIDGNGISFMGQEKNDAYDLKPFDEVDPRPHVITIIGGKSIKIMNITMKDAAYWGIHLVGCHDVSMEGLFIYNCLKIRNSDGIDLDHCQNVNISNCHIESGDDCICFKNRREYAEFGPCKDITITGCTMVSTSCAVKFGSENVDQIRNVTITNCIIKDSNRGIGIQNRDEGTISNIIVSNVIMECRLFSDVWWGKSEPIYITAFPRSTENHKDAGIRLPKGATSGEVGQVSNITFANIRCKSENGVFVGSYATDKVRDVRFEGVDIAIDKTTDYPGGIYDCRPCAGPDTLEGRTAGFFLYNVSDVNIVDCSLIWGPHRADYFETSIIDEGSVNVKVKNFDFAEESRTGHTNLKMIK
ncbi:glycoside hydrolase family 28 protein [Fulvivirga sp. M361]|uniref:glycoside hydrolase family 28 protein n=1 Tax=Fulvivirga sp. M361 TaxID=2594266 RepID=UPI00117ACCCF|nr:glycosyl hydrolase family 28 protein [Fulvivirga sp. M361]TRX61832.1 glycoside hydrolase family 28 protein [Fulvivirga sp. M361]